MAGVSPDQLARYIKGQSSPPFEVLAKLAIAKGVSLDWVATGTGAMRHDDLVATIRPAGPQSRGVPIYDAALSLGQGRLNGDAPVVGYLDLPDEYVRDVLHAPPGKVVVAYSSGDSMSPTIKDHDLVLINTAVDTFSRDDLYAFSFKEEGYIKRLQRAGDAVVVHSDNPAYTDWSITGTELRELRVIGRVVGIIQRP
ncbi:putative Phage repressor [uncultured Alphaproteobacteria bacterium]|uniref:Putative Phage repressor n=1 Tax=uncultured Alphaproteobacteria bacterium TaxID=91750 RepID=A0A212IUA3_9PROT|nr:putative Phage repressor [uncultured Alphaproteobacteria bacterium]